MKQESLDRTQEMSISELREEYLEKTEEVLPDMADSNWDIRYDHCFQRVVLDNLFSDEWYSHVPGQPAYKHLTRQQLRKAIEIADRMIEGGYQVVNSLNQKSLRFRDQVEPTSNERNKNNRKKTDVENCMIKSEKELQKMFFS